MSTEPFLFVGDQLALDFLNTVVTLTDPPTDLLATPRDLAAWWTAAAEFYPELGAAPRVTKDVFERMRSLRSTLNHEIANAVERGTFGDSFISKLNVTLSDARPRLERTRDGVGMKIEPSSGDQSMPLAIALSAADLVTSEDVPRLHQCGNDRCSLFFMDRTKSGTRRWCSTHCFDQVRAREKRRRLKDARPN